MRNGKFRDGLVIFCGGEGEGGWEVGQFLGHL